MKLLPFVEQSASASHRQRALPFVPARRPDEYLPGQQEAPAALTSLIDMLRWAQNYARSRSLWPLGFGLACCGMEMIAAASARPI
jgi:NADH-quinone oxidoreductase subunit B